jgi:hypothetical protein
MGGESQGRRERDPLSSEAMDQRKVVKGSKRRQMDEP